MNGESPQPEQPQYDPEIAQRLHERADLLRQKADAIADPRLAQLRRDAADDITALAQTHEVVPGADPHAAALEATAARLRDNIVPGSIAEQARLDAAAALDPRHSIVIEGDFNPAADEEREEAA